MTEPTWQETARLILGLSQANTLVGKRVKVTWHDYTMKRGYFRFTKLRRRLGRTPMKKNTHTRVGVLTGLKPDYSLAFHTASHLEEFVGVFVDDKFVCEYHDTVEIAEEKPSEDE